VTVERDVRQAVFVAPAPRDALDRMRRARPLPGSSGCPPRGAGPGDYVSPATRWLHATRTVITVLTADQPSAHFSTRLACTPST
jgi:hypothetical protein